MSGKHWFSIDWLFRTFVGALVFLFLPVASHGPDRFPSSSMTSSIGRIIPDELGSPDIPDPPTPDTPPITCTDHCHITHLKSLENVLANWASLKALLVQISFQVAPHFRFMGLGRMFNTQTDRFYMARCSSYGIEFIPHMVFFSTWCQGGGWEIETSGGDIVKRPVL